MNKRLEELFGQIPKFQCEEGCTECCGPVMWGKAEDQLINEWLSKRGMRKKKRYIKLDASLVSRADLTCPYIQNARCQIYPVRPLICRLYGAVEELKCPFGCGPEKLLSREEADKIMHEVMTLE